MGRVRCLGGRVIRDPNTRLWTKDLPQLGDWLDPKALPTLPGRRLTHPFLVADAYLVHVTGRVAHVVNVIVETATAEKYEREAHHSVFCLRSAMTMSPALYL